MSQMEIPEETKTSWGQFKRRQRGSDYVRSGSRQDREWEKKQAEKKKNFSSEIAAKNSQKYPSVR